MIFDEISARAIIEHALNLSGSATCVVATDVSPPSTVKAMPKGDSGTCKPPAQFPSESGHWYDPKTGQQVELPPRTWTKTYIARGYVPGVTTIGKQTYKEAIRRYDVERAIKFSSKVLCDPMLGDPWLITEEQLISEVWQLMKADSNDIMGRGKELHTAIELYAQGGAVEYLPWAKHVAAVEDACHDHGIMISTGSIEHSFATSRYGGKIDWHNDEWLLDFKTKPSIIDGKRLAYPEHAQQLAAYEHGLWHVDNGNLVMPCNRRCANVFVGADDAQVVFHEWKEKDLLQGWREFDALCSYWWIRNSKS